MHVKTWGQNLTHKKARHFTKNFLRPQVFLLVQIKYLVSSLIFQKLNNYLKWDKVKLKKIVKSISIIYLVCYSVNFVDTFVAANPIVFSTSWNAF